jgi:hypothetical protein
MPTVSVLCVQVSQILVLCAVGNSNVSKSIAYNEKSKCRLAAELELAKKNIAQNTEDIMNMGGKSTKVQYNIAKNQFRKFETNNPRKGITLPQSQFPHSCVCERLIYSHDRSAYSAAGNMWTDPENI